LPVGANFTGVGNNYAALYTTAALTESPPRAGIYDFSLAQGQVYFTGDGRSSLPSSGSPALAQLNAATLQVNFSNQTFATHLAMSYPQAAVSAVLDMSGIIQANGYFGASNQSSLVSGSTNGANAGMAFTQQAQSPSGTPIGTFDGTTLWSHK